MYIKLRYNCFVQCCSLCRQMGAFMNEAYQAQHGLEPGLFPEAVPTYLGHYHLPHTVGDSNVRYVGSPYQGTIIPSMLLIPRLNMI